MSDIVPITEEWLKSIGFRWHQFDRQPDKHWLLWIGRAFEEDSIDLEDIGLELAPGYDGKWHCWFRSDAGGRYGRFLHVRYLRWQQDLIGLLEGIIGRRFDPAHVVYGGLRTAETAERFRREDERLDRRLRAENPWRKDGADPSEGGVLPEDREFQGSRP